MSTLSLKTFNISFNFFNFGQDILTIMLTQVLIVQLCFLFLQLSFKGLEASSLLLQHLFDITIFLYLHPVNIHFQVFVLRSYFLKLGHGDAVVVSLTASELIND